MPSTPDTDIDTEYAPGAHRHPHIGWRLLALFYDLWPALALWMLLSLAFTLAYTFLGHHAIRQNIAPFSAVQLLLWTCCWLVTGLYATISWHRGGQTLGMRPWRLHVVAIDGARPRPGALWLRYAAGTLSLLAGGIGFWWAWLDRDRLTLHDRLSRTRVQRRPKPPRA
ncbi:MAG: RDD family protein [Pseudoxanthomonas sp.]